MQKNEIISRYAECAEDKILLAHILDLESVCIHKNIPAAGHFLDAREQALILRMMPVFSVRPVLWGGYDDAERQMFFFLPDYMAEAPEDALAVVHAEKHDAHPLSHRDYLGASVGLGVRREEMGDILVSENGAQLIIKSSLSDFFLTSFSSAGRVRLSVTVQPIHTLSIVEKEPIYKTVSVASLRADVILAAAFSLSRTEAAEAIAAGKVFMDGLPLFKADKTVSEGARLRLRGKGRFVLKELGGTSRKGRLFVTLCFS